MNFYILTPSQGWWRERALRAKYLLPCCRILDSLQFDMRRDHVLKRLNFELMTPFQVTWRGGEELRSKLFATMLLHSWFSFIWNATWPCSEKVEFWTADPIHITRVVGGGVVCGQNSCYHVAAFSNFIFNMTMFWKSWILIYWPHP